MASVNGSNKDMTDEVLERELQQLKDCLNCNGLWLAGNQLMNVPNLQNYPQFGQLKDLDLRYNYITTLAVEHIPLTTESFLFCNNGIDDVPDISALMYLKWLSLRGNHIKRLIPSHIPRSVTWLGVSYNDLNEVGDFSNHTNLKKLFVQCNPLSVIVGLPSSIKTLKIDSPVEELGVNCFNEIAYAVLKEVLDITHLKQPPTVLFVRGIKTVKNYYEEKLVKCSQARYVDISFLRQN